MRFLRAFLLALWLTLRGKPIQPKVAKYPILDEWVRVGIQRVMTVFRIADKEGWTEDKRKTFKLKIEGRDMAMETILGAVLHNMEREYPLLLDSDHEHAPTTLYALNLNDQYRVEQLKQAPTFANTAVANALNALSEHLRNVPPAG